MAEEDDLYDDSFYLGSCFRTMRHSRCLMTPLSLIFLLIFVLLATFKFVMSFPGIVLGLLLAPVLRRSAFFIEFLYPWSIAKWGHFFLVNRGRSSSSNNNINNRNSDKNRGFHSRTVEQRVEVVPGRIYIHPIPQFSDNLSYLVVCLPPSFVSNRKNNSNNNNNNNNNNNKNGDRTRSSANDGDDKIVAFLIDCGQADSTVRAVQLIQQFHYDEENIEIQSILCTHKHHDHTGGTRAFLKHKSGMGAPVGMVFGGAVERVPQCTNPVADGDIVPLPNSGSNDMNSLAEVEVIAVPAHTRGSVVFRLRPKVPPSSPSSEFLFMGDSMFSGGAGVPFESDVGQGETERELKAADGNSFFRGGNGSIATERCFAEVLSRTMPGDETAESLERILIFTGHEYTADLLARQFNSNLESCRWRHFSPQDFFETAAQLYTALHRRSLPHNTGRILNIPSPLSREIRINPNFRSMKRYGEAVVRAIDFWYDNFCKFKASPALYDQQQQREKEKMIQDSSNNNNNQHYRAMVAKTPSETRSWTLDTTNFSRSAFTTVYTEDLECVIADIESGKVGMKEGAAKLRQIARNLEDPVVTRRPIPGFLPSNRNIWRGVSGLARLGSKVSGMTLSDSRRMKTAPPIDSNSDRILISLRRLLVVLGRMGLLRTRNGDDVTYRVKQLFREASIIMKEEFDAEMDETQDEIEIGVLKWMLYGVHPVQPSCLAKACCMPFSRMAKQRELPDHPARHFKKKAGELVSHDIYTCKICRQATGCFDVGTLEDGRPGHEFHGSARPPPPPQDNDNEVPSDEFGVEIPFDEPEGVQQQQMIEEQPPHLEAAPRKTEGSSQEGTQTESESRSQSPLQYEPYYDDGGGDDGVEVRNASSADGGVTKSRSISSSSGGGVIAARSGGDGTGKEGRGGSSLTMMDDSLAAAEPQALSELISQLTVSIGTEGGGEGETEISLDGGGRIQTTM